MTLTRWLIGVFLIGALTLVVISSARSGPEHEAVMRHMHEHVQFMGAIRAAIFAGDLDAIQEPAQWLAKHDPPPGLPAGWQAFFEAKRNDPCRVHRAKNLVAAAYATSKMVLPCANCHQASDVAIEFKQVALSVTATEGVATHTRQHRWAVDRLWGRLIGGRGMATFSPAQRSQLCSEFLSLCVDFHATLERGPRK